MNELPTNIHCLLVEDDPYLADFVVDTLATLPWIENTTVVSSCVELLNTVGDLAPPLILLDLSLTDGSSLPHIPTIRKLSPESKLLIFSQRNDERVVLDAFAKGAHGYVLKGADEYELSSAIKAQLQGGTPMSPAIAGYLVKNVRQVFSEENPLSERETEVLRLLSRGCSYDEVASLLTVKRTTIATYVRRIYEKLGVHSCTQAVFEAQKSGWIG